MWDKLKEQFNLLKLEKKKLCLITNSDKFISKDVFLDAVASALQGGVDIVLLNETNIPDGVIADIGRKIRILCDEYGATYIVNSRADIAMITEADGVHLEQNGLSVSDVREIAAHNTIIGKTVHTPDEIKNALRLGVDYLILKPISTNSEVLVSPEFASDVIKSVEIPVFIGGDITTSNIKEFSSYGIDKIAVGEALMYAKIPEITAREFLRQL